MTTLTCAACSASAAFALASPAVTSNPHTDSGGTGWVIERTFAWLTGYRRLTIRYERSASLYCAFVTLAAALTCHKRYLKLTT